MAVELAGGIVPPGVELVEAIGPVDLRRDEVDGTGLEPLQGVGVNLVVLPVAGDGGEAVFRGDVSGRSHAGGRDTEGQIGLHSLDAFVDAFHHFVDVGAAPVGKRQAVAFLLPQGIVGGIGAGGGATGGIEIVVEYHAVNVVLGDAVHDNVHNALFHLFHTGVEGGLLRVLYEPVGMAVLILERAAIALVVVIAVGVEPCIDLDAVGVGGLDVLLQGVSSRSVAAGAGGFCRPGLIG